MKQSKHVNLLSTIAIFFMILIMLFSMIVFQMRISDTTEGFQSKEPKVLNEYYVMIVDDHSSSFWNSVYQNAQKLGEKSGVYIELMGNEYMQNYSREDCLRIAIESEVDGIFLEADESSEMTELINEAVDKGIPVITAFGDNSASKRQSFVGVSSYNLGLEYGNQVLPLAGAGKTKVMILMTANAKDSGQNIVFSGIQSVVSSSTKASRIQVESLTIDRSTSFAVEESIRDIFMKPENLPDILICLDEISTACCYQATIDYNKVGEVNILGYYDSKTILNAISREVVHSTVSIAPEQTASYLLEAISEYKRFGQVSGYYPVDTKMITSDNVSELMGGEPVEE